ncbi:MAG: VanZ family protein, partial [Leptothrix sp. (in: b-proteobacteria)]
MSRRSPGRLPRQLPIGPSPIPPHGLRQSSAWPLSLAWLALIVYASLHPFSGWHGPDADTPAAWLALLWLPAPKSSRFDLWSNFLAYQPLGLLLAVAWMRSGRRTLSACAWATLVGVLLSFSMESLQHLLPTRVPSRIDWAVNSAGTLVGAAAAALLREAGGLDLWQRLRNRWFVPHGNAGLALLLTWPVALLFPPPLPMGLGHGLARAAQALQDALEDTPLADWVPLPVISNAQPGGLELVVIVAGLLAPCWVAFVMT